MAFERPRPAGRTLIRRTNWRQGICVTPKTNPRACSTLRHILGPHLHQAHELAPGHLRDP